MDTPWTRAKKARHELQEQRIGRMEGGARQNNSGRIWRWHRDNTLHNFLVEARTTKADSYRIDRKEFHNIRKEGFQTPPGLLAAMQIDFHDLHLMVTELSVFQERELRLIELETRVEALEAELAKVNTVK